MLLVVFLFLCGVLHDLRRLSNCILYFRTVYIDTWQPLHTLHDGLHTGYLVGLCVSRHIKGNRSQHYTLCPTERTPWSDQYPQLTCKNGTAPTRCHQTYSTIAHAR